jgi:hypothetical protein
MPVICPTCQVLGQSASVPTTAGYFAWGCFRYFGFEPRRRGGCSKPGRSVRSARGVPRRAKSRQWRARRMNEPHRGLRCCAPSPACGGGLGWGCLTVACAVWRAPPPGRALRVDLPRKRERCSGASGTISSLHGRKASRRLRRLQSEPRLDSLAHHEFLDLAGHGHWEFVDKFHVARNLVVRDLSLTEATDLLGGQRLA